MALAAGTRLGVYEITVLLGVGGMGEVYRARDTRLKRDVAMKILPESLAADSDRLARFQREAEVLASLNHPHIAAIYGLEEQDGTRALVMELVEGETLANRIARGPLPMDEALPIARQIAEAVEAAHEQGIIHRDLKPANITVRPDGTVKVLDFGLAKAFGPPEAAHSVSTGPAAVSPSLAPTITSPAMTGLGIVLGTAAYMSPEQARGKAVDTRSDIWAFGCVLYEMLCGKPAFDGESVTAVIARVLERDPDWSALPATTSGRVQYVLRRCLHKVPRQRFHHIADVRIELEDVDASEPGGSNVRRERVRPWVPWLVAAIAAGAALAVALWPASPGASREVMHLDLPSPADVEVQADASQAFALSPDGRWFAMVGVRDGVRRVFVRRLAEPDFREIPGSARSNGVAFSPESDRLAFVVGTVLTMYSLSDGSTSVLAAGADFLSGLAWGEAGIAFVRENAIWFVAPTGGAPRQLTTLDVGRGEVLHAGPGWVAGQPIVLFSSLANDMGTERIEAVSVEGTPHRWVVLERATLGGWSPTGHLIFQRDGAMMAVPLDPKSLQAAGPVMTVMPAGEVAANSVGGASAQITRSGTLMYVPAAYGRRSVVMVNRDGLSIPLAVAPARFTNPRLSPDGRRLVVDDSFMTEVLIDLDRGTRSVLQPPAAGSGYVAWNSDGSRIVFRRFNHPHSMAADGRADVAVVPHAGASDYASGSGPDPDSMLMVRIGTDTSGDIYLFSLSGAFMPRPLVTGRGYQGGGQLSPDGRWLLYQSDESGQPEIYVRAYPTLDRAWQVSEGGGTQPRWSRDGSEIVFRDALSMIAVAFDGGGARPVLGRPAPLFRQPFTFGQTISVPNYDVAPGGRFVMLRAEPTVAPFHVILNWTNELQRLLDESR